MPLEYRFPPRTTVVCADGTDLHGCVGVVVGVSPDDATKVRVQLHVPEKEPPFGLNIASALREKSWVGAAKAAQLLKVTPDTLGRLSGGAWVSARTGTGRGKEQSYNVGLQLKGRSPDSGPIYLPGFVDRGSAQGQGGWKYSHAAIRLIAAYKLAWPQLIAAFDALPRDERTLDASRTIGAAAGLMLPKVLVWLSQLPTTKIPRVPMSSMVMSPAAVKAIEVTTAAIAAKSMQNPVQKVRRFILLRACFRKRGCSQRPFFSSCPLSLSLSLSLSTPTPPIYIQVVDIDSEVLLRPPVGDYMAPIRVASNPLLGERVLNVRSPSVPFGLRGGASVLSLTSAISSLRAFFSAAAADHRLFLSLSRSLARALSLSLSLSALFVFSFLFLFLLHTQLSSRGTRTAAASRWCGILRSSEAVASAAFARAAVAICSLGLSFSRSRAPRSLNRRSRRSCKRQPSRSRGQRRSTASALWRIRPCRRAQLMR